MITARKAAKVAARAKRMEQSTQMRQAVVTGDDRDLPARARGPLRRFLCDRVGARWMVAEFLLPLMVMVLMLPFFRTSWAATAFL